MKTPIIFCLLLIKSLIGLNSANLESTTEIKNNTSDQIQCYNCAAGHFSFGLGRYQHNGKLETEYESFAPCPKESWAITQGSKDKFLCRAAIEKKLSMLGYINTLIRYSMVKKEDCIAKNQIHDTICEDSSCKKLAICCDGNLCNEPINLGLKRLVYYYNDNNKNAENNYLKYTNTSCELDKTAEIKHNNQASKRCVVATNKEIYDFNKNIREIATANTEAYEAEVEVDNNEDSDDLKDDQEDLIASDKIAIDTSKKLVLKLKMWLKVSDKDKDKDKE